MPTMRGSALLCDQVDELGQVLEYHGRSVINLIDVVEQVTGDGIVEPSETKLLLSTYRAHRASFVQVVELFRPLPGRASEQDDALMCIGAIAGAGRVSRHAYSKVKQAHEDAA